jgi:hypothetical protein
MVAYDILNGVLDYLVTAFTQEMRTTIATSDPLRLQLIGRAPLQDDPTDVAPFVLVGLDYERGRIPDPFHEPEIGSGPAWLNFFRILGRVVPQESKETAYTATAALNSRAIATILKHHRDLESLVAEDGERVFDCCYPDLITNNIVRPFGGENEWFGEFQIYLHLFSVQPLSVFG